MLQDEHTTPPIHFSNGVWYVGATRVQLYGVISMWLQGYSAEEIEASFTPLSLRDAYGAIFTYLEHSQSLDAAFRKQDALFNRLRAQSEAQQPDRYAEMRARIARFRTAAFNGQAS
jgi:hypothetical protein